MDLLLEIKRYLIRLQELEIYQGDIGLATLDIIAEDCFHRHYRKLTKYITKDLSPEVQKDLKSRVKKIKEIVKREG